MAISVLGSSVDSPNKPPQGGTTSNQNNTTMAQYNVKHACGCERTYNLFGKHSDRDRKLEWLSGQDCPDCKRKAEEETAKAATEGMELPELEGSEKQVKWANTIRARFITEARNYNTHNRHTRIDVDKVLAGLASIKTARFFIDNRNEELIFFLVLASRENAQKPAETPAPAKVEETPAPATIAPEKGSEWGKVAINAQNVECTTERGAKIKMPHSSEHDGFSVWVSLKLLREGRHGYEYMLSVKSDMTFTLKKYGKGRYNKSEVLAEKTISAEEMADAFGGWVENAPRTNRPAVDPDKVTITRHEPAPLAPVEIEADAELTR